MDEIKAQPVGKLWQAIGAVTELLIADPAKAESAARDLLEYVPAQAQALQIVVSARRVQNDIAGAREFLETMAAQWPHLAAVHYELGLLLAEMGERDAAIEALSRVVKLESEHPSAWRALGEELAQRGDSGPAAKALARHCRSSIIDLKTLEDARDLGIDQIEAAVNLLHEYLSIYSTDVDVMRVLGELYLRINRNEPAEELLERALELAPDFTEARVSYVSVLHWQMKWREENDQLDILLEQDPNNPEYRYFKAMVLFRLGRTAESLRFCETIIGDEPDNARFRLAHAYALRSAGRTKDCIAAFRKSIEIRPGLGESWWGLANLKVVRFSPAEIDAMRNQLARTDLDEEERCHIHFALGRALEDSKDYPQSFAQYRLGNASRRARNPYNPEGPVEQVRRTRRRFTREFFRANADRGCTSTAPIFIPGLPRSGSTLVEQILASHSLVEGASELPALGIVAVRLALKEHAGGATGAPLEGEDWRALGEEYLELARAFRRLDRPRFTDKMPGNFNNLGLICAILPNAKIIDVRRHPLDCCLSNFKNNFPDGSGPSYDLADMGAVYRSYVELMAHFDEVQPGRVYRLFYEDLVRDPELEIRRLLKYCDLPFEEKCLRHHETDRSNLTASSEQVRRPVYREGVDQWRSYEQWLDPLKQALGSVLDLYPAVPKTFDESRGDTDGQAERLRRDGTGH